MKVELRHRPVTPYHHETVRAAADYLLPIAGHGATLLDVGCGWGDTAGEFTALGFSVIGLDCDPSALAMARRLAPQAHYVLADAQFLPFADSSVDAVLSLSMIQYGRWRSIVEECSRVLQPGGRAVFVENLVGNPFVRLYRLFRRLAWAYPNTPLLRRLSMEQRTIGHVAWTDRLTFYRWFKGMDASAHHLLTPVLLAPALFGTRRFRLKWIPSLESRLFRAVAAVDRALLERFPYLARFAWIGVIKVAKDGHRLRRRPPESAPSR